MQTRFFGTLTILCMVRVFCFSCFSTSNDVPKREINDAPNYAPAMGGKFSAPSAPASAHNQRGGNPLQVDATTCNQL